MRDEGLRELERVYAASPTPENEERYRVARCKVGDHEFSHWEPVLERSWGDPDNRGGKPIRYLGRDDQIMFDVRPGYRTVLVRVCFWCFQKEYRRHGVSLGEELTAEQRMRDLGYGAEISAALARMEAEAGEGGNPDGVEDDNTS